MWKLRTGERVYLNAAPSSTGTVTKVSADGFRVTWDLPDRKRNEPRIRRAYPWAMAPRFGSGKGPGEHA